MEGRLLHEVVDAGVGEKRGGARISRGIALHSRSLGLVGRADAVEFRDRGRAVFPIEYKRGKAKIHRADEVQLCAQAMCLEEMLDIVVPSGALFYGSDRRRHLVSFDEDLSALTAHVAAEVRLMLKESRTPPAAYAPSCKRCSLYSLCAPKQLVTARPVTRWLSERMGRALEET